MKNVILQKLICAVLVPAVPILLACCSEEGISNAVDTSEDTSKDALDSNTDSHTNKTPDTNSDSHRDADTDSQTDSIGDTSSDNNSIVNCDNFWGDTTDIPTAANVLTFKFLNRTNGQFTDDQVWWSFKNDNNDELHTVAELPYYDMPANNSGRMYFFLGTDGRQSEYADFIEFTIGEDAFHGNTTEVDGVALKLAIRMHCADGYDVEVGRTCETFMENRQETWDAFFAQTPTEFHHLAQLEGNKRILNPGWGEFSENGLYEHYWDAYVNEVWNIHNPGYPKPTAYLGGLGGEPDMSAALHRHTAHLPKDQWEDEAQFYQTSPANYYAEFWHKRSIDNRCYGFPYDDVGGYSTYISHSQPEYLLVAIGF